MWGAPRSGVQSGQKSEPSQQQNASKERSPQSGDSGAIQEGETVGWDPVSDWDGPNPDEPVVFFLVGAVAAAGLSMVVLRRKTRLAEGNATLGRVEQS